jgi:acyl dehydratase
MTPAFASVTELLGSVGDELGPSRWFLVDQERIDGFARVTEDEQWIHVDSTRASTGPFGVTIAHGYLTLSLVAPHRDGVADRWPAAQRRQLRSQSGALPRSGALRHLRPDEAGA